MTTKKSMLTSIVIAFLFGGVVGAVSGGYFGFQSSMKMYLNDALSKDARDITSCVASLRELRAGQQEKAIVSFEVHMDDSLIMMDPQTPYPGLKPHTVDEIRKAIKQAKLYRSEYPHANKDNMRAKMVNSIFERNLYE